MASWTAQRAGNWSRTSDNADSPWHDGGTQTARASAPTGGDTVTLGAYAVADDIPTLPASGTLSSLTATSGQLTVDISGGNKALNVTTLSAGTNDTGLINISGAAPGNTCTLTATSGTLTSGAGSYDYVIYHNSTGSFVLEGNPALVTGGGSYASVIRNHSTGNMTLNVGNTTGGTGSVGVAAGVVNISSGTITINAGDYSLTGGSGPSCPAVKGAGTGQVTINGGNLVDSDQSCALEGRIRWITGTANYRRFKGSAGATVTVYPSNEDPGIANVKDGYTYDFGGAEKEGEYSPGGTFAEGQADQLAADVATINAAVAYIRLDVQIMDGTNLGLLNVPAKKDTRWGVLTGYGQPEGDEGTLVVPAESDVKKGVGFGNWEGGPYEFTGEYVGASLSRTRLGM